MAVRGRTWSAIDKSVQQLFIKLRERGGNQPMPKLANEMGLSYSRFRDLLNAQHGTPTLGEFITICSFFGVDPATELREISDQHGITTKAQQTVDEDYLHKLLSKTISIKEMALQTAEEAAELHAQTKKIALESCSSGVKHKNERDSYFTKPRSFRDH